MNDLKKILVKYNENKTHIGKNMIKKLLGGFHLKFKSNHRMYIAFINNEYEIISLHEINKYGDLIIENDIYTWNWGWGYHNSSDMYFENNYKKYVNSLREYFSNFNSNVDGNKNKVSKIINSFDSMINEDYNFGKNDKTLYELFIKKYILF